eukprot:13626525-Alexandrium_andersonii.AAC.1
MCIRDSPLSAAAGRARRRGARGHRPSQIHGPPDSRPRGARAFFPACLAPAASAPGTAPLRTSRPFRGPPAIFPAREAVVALAAPPLLREPALPAARAYSIA